MLVFVIGTGRCGSSLLHEIMARHPDVGFVSNIDDRLGGLDLAGRWNQTIYRRIPNRFTEKGRLRYAPSEAYNVLDKQVSPILSAPSRDLLAEDVTPWLANRLRQFFERRAEAQGRPVFLHKFTGWPRSGLLHEVFPEARFINVVRDGRAVANSLLQMDWWSGYRGPGGWSLGPLDPERQRLWDESGRSYVVLAGLEWDILMDAFDAARRRVPAGKWLDVRYEDVLADPRAQLARMLEFSGLTWTPDFDTAFARYSFGSGRSEAFRKDLGPGALATLEPVIARHLLAQGYSLTPG
jgi:hypothetical protein